MQTTSMLQTCWVKLGHEELRSSPRQFASSLSKSTVTTSSQQLALLRAMHVSLLH